MSLSPLGIDFVVYVLCGGLLWLTAHLLAPVGCRITLWRGVGAALLVSLAGIFLPPLIEPLFGVWCRLAVFIVWVVIVKSVLWLPFWRSVLTIVIYLLVIIAARYIVYESPLAKKPRVAFVSSTG